MKVIRKKAGEQNDRNIVIIKTKTRNLNYNNFSSLKLTQKSLSVLLHETKNELFEELLFSSIMEFTFFFFATKIKYKNIN